MISQFTFSWGAESCWSKRVFVPTNVTTVLSNIMIDDICQIHRIDCRICIVTLTFNYSSHISNYKKQSTLLTLFSYVLCLWCIILWNLWTFIRIPLILLIIPYSMNQKANIEIAMGITIGRMLDNLITLQFF